MKPPISILSGIINLIVTALSFADFAPTQYHGSNIVPIDAPDIRMISAKVDIDWGTPCDLAAVFIFENETTDPINVQLGFPVELPSKLRKKNTPDIRIQINGNTISKKDIAERAVPEDSYQDAIWYLCQYSFPPSQTTVTVSLKLPASRTRNWPYRERLYYCMLSGNHWKDTIGYEEVNIN